MYADDLVIIAPTVRGQQSLVNVCQDFAASHDVIFNHSKSMTMIFRPKGDTSALYDSLFLNGEQLKIVARTKYLGHFITNDLSDHTDIARQCRQMYVQGNTLIRKFHMCSIDVKVRLFKTFCSAMYTPHLWWNYTKTCIRKLYVAYHTVLKIFLGFSKFDSNPVKT
jgi:hypothetical protein